MESALKFSSPLRYNWGTYLYKEKNKLQNVIHRPKDNQ